MAQATKYAAAAVLDDDLDDLDDVLDDFESGPSLAGPAAAEDFPPAPTKAAPSPPSATVAATGEDEDFPDPEEDALEDEESFAKQAQEGMAAIMNGLGSDEEAEFRTLMAEMMRGGTGGGGMGADGEFDPASFLAALGGDASLFGAAPSKAAATSSSTTGKAKGKSSATTTPAATGSFQDTIASAMNKLKDSSTTVDAEAEAKAASSGSDPLAAMMAQMAGLGEMGGEEGLQGMLDEVMDQLMSRELLYEPLKDLASKYPEYLSSNAATLSDADRKRYTEQQVIVNSIVAKFEEPGAEVTSGGSAEEEAMRKERNKAVVFLVGKMNDCGAPPTELMGAVPEGMELGPDGVPKLPGDCIIV